MIACSNILTLCFVLPTFVLFWIYFVLVCFNTSSHSYAHLPKSPEGKKDVLDNSLAELREQVEQNAGAVDDDQKCSSPCNTQDRAPGTVSSQSIVFEDLITDTSTMANNVVESRELVEENVGVAEVDQKSSGVDATVISHPSRSSENEENLKHQAEATAGALLSSMKDGSSLSEPDAYKEEGTCASNLVENVTPEPVDC